MNAKNDLKLINSSSYQALQERNAKCTSSQLEYVVPGAGFELALGRDQRLEIKNTTSNSCI
jgi:hypothetical protein